MNTGLVVEYDREYYHIMLDSNGREVMAKPRVWDTQQREKALKARSMEGVLTFAQQIAVGDRVVLSEPNSGQYVIEQCQERVSWLARKAIYNYVYRQQLVVANADQLAVVIAPNPRVKLNIVDRYFLSALQGGVKPLLVVNKIDLDRELVNSVEIAVYRELGYQVLFTSALHGEGLAGISNVLHNKLTVFCGQSGVGKSTILSQLTGLELKTQAVRPRRGTGRYTTVTTCAYPLASGGYVVDTPGIRLFGLAHLTQREFDLHFRDIAELAKGCVFRNCTHTQERACQVQAAVTQGTLSAERLRSYQKIRKECEL